MIEMEEGGGGGGGEDTPHTISHNRRSSRECGDSGETTAAISTISPAVDSAPVSGGTMNGKSGLGSILKNGSVAAGANNNNNGGGGGGGVVVDVNQNCPVENGGGDGDTGRKDEGTADGKSIKNGGENSTSSESSPGDLTKKKDWMEKLLKDSAGGVDHKPTEQDLLKKLEEANRLLEADTKSFPSLSAYSATPSHSRKSSGSSIISSNSTNSHYSCQNSNESNDDPNSVNSSESLWEIWGRIINDWESVRKRPAFLKDLVRKGIPHEFRGMAWQLVLGVHDAVWKQEYAEHMKKTSPCEKLIRRDIARTFPDHEFFKEKDGFGQESLFNVMKAYSLHDREVGYCQGSGFIVGMLLMQMPEEDAFAVLVRLMQDFRLRELFKPSMAELGMCMFKLECLIQELLPTLLVHFQTQNFDTSMYASSWFLTLYVTSLPLTLARRIMDVFVSEGMEIIFRVGIAILQSCQEDLLALDMEGLLMYLQKDLRGRFEQDTDQDNLMQTAFGVKYSHKRMKKLEKEYTALKTKENEDQIELRRLRTENKLLRQRIEHLEKESATLADHLVQDQVTRAQEAEEVYALRNELSVTRQQLMDTRGKLLDAQDIIGDIKKRTRIIEDAVYLDQGEEQNMVKHLQEELIAVRLRETETADIIKGLKVKIHDLEDTNQRLQRAPSNDVQQLQEELIAVKLREAEANLSLKELKMKVNEIEKYWEAHMDRMRQASPQGKGTKTEIRQLQEEVVTMKTKEAKALIEVKEVKQKLMEMETQNHIVTNQIRRMGEENKEIKRLMEEAEEREKDLKTNLKDLTRKLDDTESKRKEEGMMSRINEAESVQQLAELRHKIAEVDIQKEELLAACKLLDKSGSQDLENKVFDLQDEILKVKLSAARHKFKTGGSLMTDSFMGNNSDEEVDAEINDSKNLDKTLSDIIEGRSPSKHDNLATLATAGEGSDGVGTTDRTSNGGEGGVDLKSSCDSDGNLIRQSSHTCKNTDTCDDDDDDGNVLNVCGWDVSSSTPAMSTPAKGAKHSLPPVDFDSPQRETTTVIKSDNCDEDVNSSRLDDNDDDDGSQQKSEGENLRDVDESV